jgi:hypothetical protein
MAEVAKVEGALSHLQFCTMHLQPSASIETGLLEAFRQKRAKQDSSLGRAFAWRLVWLSAALFVLAVAGVQFYSSSRPHFTLESDNNRHYPKMNIQPPSSPGHSGAAAVVLHENRGPALKNLTTRQVAEHDKSHAPVGRRAPPVANDELFLNGGGSIVRVTLPFSSLTAMGLPVRPDVPETRITADVWVDPFGAVVGIRLVPAKASSD